MQENEERWRELCALAAKEQDPEKLRKLIVEINDLLAKKHKRIERLAS
jgi:hypothetical protein